MVEPSTKKEEEHKRIYTPLEAGKNVIMEMTSQKKTWEVIGIPEILREGLYNLSFYKPSIIQSISVQKIVEDPTKNFLFQALNGSGKTLAFGIPALIRVDPSNPNI